MTKATCKFDAQPLERRAEIVKNMEAEKLLDLFLIYYQNFDPIDDGFADSYNLIKGEILRRCEKS